LRIAGLKIVAGIWNFEGGSAKAQERLGTSGADLVCTTLAQAIAGVRSLSGPALVAADTRRIDSALEIPSQNK
jgi:hypothetical protein